MTTRSEAIERAARAVLNGNHACVWKEYGTNCTLCEALRAALAATEVGCAHWHTMGAGDTENGVTWRSCHECGAEWTPVSGWKVLVAATEVGEREAETRQDALLRMMAAGEAVPHYDTLEIATDEKGQP